jgi:hypothetical protein
MLTVDGTDTVNIGLEIQGKHYDAVFTKNRFEKTIDKVDTYIHRGKDLETIKRKFADHIVSIKPTKTVSVKKQKKSKKTPISAKDAVIKVFKNGMTASEVANTVHHKYPDITYASAYYQASKLAKKGKK